MYTIYIMCFGKYVMVQFLQTQLKKNQSNRISVEEFCEIGSFQSNRNKY